jgi:hypothetical protein
MSSGKAIAFPMLLGALLLWQTALAVLLALASATALRRRTT